MASLSDLLERHRPLLRYDSQDPFRACSALTIVENPGNKLVDDRGRTMAVAGDADRPLGLNLLRAEPDAAGERLDEVGDEQEIMRDAIHLQSNERYADRIYGQPLERGGATYLQYWFWLYYNPKDVAGRGRHEGDWEMIQLRLEGEEPRCAVYAQHDHARKEVWSRVRKHPAPDGPHPVVYVAAESHASYFEDGTHPSFGRADNAYGDGPEVLPGSRSSGGGIAGPDVGATPRGSSPGFPGQKPSRGEESKGPRLPEPKVG
jgi:hypothetical protein